MGNLGFAELLVIALVALVVFGPDRLPELARQAGKAMTRFRAEASKGIAELKRAADMEDIDRELKAVRDDLRDARRELLDGPGEPATPRRLPPPTDPDAT